MWLRRRCTRPAAGPSAIHLAENRIGPRMNRAPADHGDSDGPVEALTSAWLSYPPAPDLAAFIADGVRSDEQRLLDLVRVDVQNRVHRGEPVRLEDYARAISPAAVAPGTPLARLVLGFERLAGASAEKVRARLGDAYAADIDAVFSREEPMPPTGVGEADPDHDPDPEPSSHGTERARGWAKGDQIGPYKLRKRLGSGGFGEVWLASRRSPDLDVAIKVLKPGVTDEDSVRRFEVEAQALAFLEHQYVAKIHDAGTVRGLPYIAMEYVEGKPLTRYCDDRRLSFEQRLELMVRVCEGVQHAHQRGLIHRDLKPDNILVTEIVRHPKEVDEHERLLVVDQTDGKVIVAVPKVVDFGLAKAAEKTVRLTDGTLTVDLGKMMGTPEYMAPEQAGHQPHEVTQKADIFALGVILYELLSGTLPLTREELRNRAVEELVAMLRGTPRPEPSTRFGRLDEQSVNDVSYHRGEMTAKELGSRLRSRARHLCGKALRLEPDKRFSSAAMLGLDIRNYLEDKDFEEAAAEPRRDRILRNLRRHKLPYAAAASVFLALVAGIAGTTWQWQEAEHARRRANRHTAIAIERLIISEATANAKNDPGLMRLLLRELPSSPSSVLPEPKITSWLSTEHDYWPVQRTIAPGTPPSLIAWAPNSEAIIGISTEGQLWSWAVSSSNGPALLAATEHSRRSYVYEDAFSSNRRYVCYVERVADENRLNIRLTGETDSPVTLITTDGVITCKSWSPDDDRVSAIVDGIAHCWNIHGTTKATAFPTSGRATAMSWRPDGRQVAIAVGAEIQIWLADASGSPVVLRGHDEVVTAMSWNSDGSVLLTGSEDNTARIWPLRQEAGSITLRGHLGDVEAVSWSGDGRYVATRSRDGTARIWRVDGTAVPPILGTPREFSSWLPAVDWSPIDSRYLYYHGESDTVWLRDADAPDSAVALPGHSEFVTACEWAPDGQRIATAAWDGTVRVWTPDLHNPCFATFPRPPRGKVEVVCWSPDGDRLATSADDDVYVYASSEKHENVRLEGMDGNGICSLAFTPDGQQLITGTRTGTLCIRPASGSGNGVVLHEDGRDIPFWNHIACIELSPDDCFLAATNGTDYDTRIFSICRPGAEHVLRGHGAAVQAIAWSPDSLNVATASLDGTVRIWDRAQAVRPFVIDGVGPVHSIDWSPDGTMLAWSSEGKAGIWTRRGELVRLFADNPDQRVRAVKWSPDGEYIAISVDGMIQVWSLSGAVPVELKLRHGTGWTLAWSPDSRRLASTPGDEEQSTAHVWSIDNPLAPIIIDCETGSVECLAWSPDGSRLAVGSWDTRVWLLDWEKQRSSLWNSTDDYLRVEERMRYLGETQDVASENERLDREWITTKAVALQRGSPIPCPPSRTWHQSPAR
jgi:WD40 repeat protein